QKFLDQGAQAVPILVAAVVLLGLGVLPEGDLGQDLLRGSSCRLGPEHLSFAGQHPTSGAGAPVLPNPRAQDFATAASPHPETKAGHGIVEVDDVVLAGR